jgi:adenosine kinase
MPARTLICGSIAFDTIMVFPDRFRKHILPEQTHILSVAFEVNELRREFGGCAGNIAYTLKLLGGEPVVMATIGEDGEPYRRRLDHFRIATDGLRTVPDTYTAQAFITTDLDDNQITAFHPGAMNHSHRNRIDEVTDIALAIVAPDGRDGMIAHCEQLHAAGVPYIFDPGQGLPLFSGEELHHLIDIASHVALNDYEAELLQERTALRLEKIAHMVAKRGGALIVTSGARGSKIYADGTIHAIPTAPATAEVDPTGCGDAYRAGLLYGIAQHWDWGKTGRLAALLGALKIACRGGQNHTFTREKLGELYYRQFQAPLW